MTSDTLPLCPVCLDGEHHDGGCENCGREASPAITPAGGMEETAAGDAVSSTPMAYLAIHDGECTEICMEEPRSGLIRFIEIAIGCGGYVERVPLEVARQALYRPWPQVYAAAPITAPAPAPDLVEKVVADLQKRCPDLFPHPLVDTWTSLARAAIQAVQKAQYQPMSTAPVDRPILIFNQATGWYLTECEDGKFPLHVWNGKHGVWYPEPMAWSDLPLPTGGL